MYGHGDLEHIRLDYPALWLMVKGMGARWYLLNSVGEEEGLKQCKDHVGQQLIVQPVLTTGIRLL